MNRYHCKPSAMFWTQGEQEAKFKQAAVSYYRNFSNLINAVRSQIHFPESPFIFGMIHSPDALYEGVKEVRAAQRQAARTVPKCFMIDTDILPKLPDHLYYNAQGKLN